MDLEELRSILQKLEPGKAAGIGYDVYAALFPPGEPDQRAREVCYHFAKQLGCRIENKPKDQAIWFVKDA